MSVTVIEGSNAVFVCQASALPRPVIQWYHYNPVSNSTSPVMDGGPKYNIVETIEGERVMNSILTVLSTNVSDFGEYMCTASNVVGAVSATTSLTINGESLLFHVWVLEYVYKFYNLLQTYVHAFIK